MSIPTLLRTYVYTCCCLLAVAPLHAQDKLEGSVAETDGTPVISAQVLLMEGEQILDYTLSDADGKFSIECPATLTSEVDLLVRSFGYTTLRLARNDWPADLRLVLENSAVDLMEISVTAESLPIVQRQDTLIYTTKAYTNGSEQKVEDLLKKLPGVEVDEQGSISVGGRAVDRVLVQGQDAFGKNYRMVTRNMGAGYVERVEVIDNYSDDQLVGDLEQGDELILNLELDQGMKSVLFGNLNVSHGVPAGTDNDLNAFRLAPEITTILFAQHNTMGMPASSGQDLNIKTGNGMANGATGGAPLLTAPGAQRPRTVGTEQYLKNSVYAAAGSLLLEPGEHLRSRTLFSVDKTDERLDNTTETTLLADQLRLNQSQFYDHRTTERRSWAQSENRWSLDPQSRVDFDAEFSVAPFQAASAIRTFAEGVTDELQTAFAAKPLYAGASLRYVRRLNTERAVRFYLEGYTDRNDQEVRYLGPRYSGWLPAAGEGATQYATQQLNSLAPTAEYLYGKGGRKFTLRIGHRHEAGNLTTHLLGLGANDTIQSVAANLLNFRLAETYSEVNVQQQFTKFTLGLSSRFGFISLESREATSGETRFADLAVQPRLYLEYAPGSRTRIDVSLASEIQRPGITDLLPELYLSDYQTFTLGLPQAYLQRRHVLSANYKYHNAFHQLAYSFGAQHSVVPDGIASELSVTPYFAQRQLTRGSAVSVTQIRSSLSKYVDPLRGTLAASFNLVQFANQVTLGQAEQNSTYRVLQGKLSYQVRFNPWSQLSLSSAWFNAKNYLQAQTEVASQGYGTWIIGGEAALTPGERARLFIRANHYRWNQTGATTNTTLVEAKFEYRLNQKINVYARALNLLNQGSIEQRSVNAYQLNSYRFPLRERTLLLGINWDF